MSSSLTSIALSSLVLAPGILLSLRENARRAYVSTQREPILAERTTRYVNNSTPSCSQNTFASTIASTPVNVSEQEYETAIQRHEEWNQQLTKQYSQLNIMPINRHVLALHTIIRDQATKRSEFVFFSDQLLRLLLEFAVTTLEYKHKNVISPTNLSFPGATLTHPVCGVSIMRAGESMELALRSVFRTISIGKLLIQRDETQHNKPARLFYTKLPNNIHHCQILLMDPMLATGASAILAVQQLVADGVDPERITFVNLISSPEGIHAFASAFPQITIVTGYIDERLNDEKYIVPGIGDFGDRYFGTTVAN